MKAVSVRIDRNQSGQSIFPSSNAADKEDWSYFCHDHYKFDTMHCPLPPPSMRVDRKKDADT